MNPLLCHATTPLLGALIGYFTSRVAIRMLFRPLTPWHILGFKIPLTPGIIPAKRHELAENIGEMVGDHLLTGPDIRKALSEEGFSQELKRTVEARISHLLNLQLGPLASLVPERYRGNYTVGVKILRWRFLKLLHNHMDSEEFARDLGRHLAEQADEGKERAVAEILAALRSTRGKQVLDRLITELVEEKILARPIGTLADLLPREVRNSLGEDALQVLSDVLVREIPAVLDSLKIRQVVTARVDSLNLLRLEELLLGFMRERCTAIYRVAALLGFLLGSLPLLLLGIN